MGCASSKSGSGEGIAVNKVDCKAENQLNMVTNTVENEVNSGDAGETFKDDLSQAQSELERKASTVENSLNIKETNAENNLERKVNNIDSAVDREVDNIEHKADQQVNEAERTVKRKTDGIENDIDNKVNSSAIGTNLDQNNENKAENNNGKNLRYAKKMEITVIDTGTDDLANKVGKKRKMVQKENQEAIGDENKSLNDSVNNDENGIGQNNDSVNPEEAPDNAEEVDKTE